MRNLDFDRVSIGKERDGLVRGYFRGLRRVLGMFLYVAALGSRFVLGWYTFVFHCIRDGRLSTERYCQSANVPVCIRRYGIS